MTTPSTQADYELIQRFLDFELSAAELAEVENRLANDTVFQERLARYQEMELHVEQINEMPGTARVVELPTVRSVWKKGYAIAAMLVLALGLLFVLKLFSGDQESAQILAQTYWEEQTDWSTAVRSTDTTVGAQEGLSATAVTAIQNEDWATALSVLEQSEESITGLLWIGKIYQEQGNYEKAVLAYDRVIELDEVRQDEAYWYRALAQLQLGEFDAAKRDLEAIVAADYPFAVQAKTLLKKL